MNNHTIRLSLWLCFLIPSLAIGAQERKQLLSPSGTLKAEITVDKKSAQIKVYEKGEKIVSINALQFTLEKDVLKGDLQIVHSTENTVNQTWQPIYGERSLIPERYNEVRIRLQSSVDRKEIALIARMYDEGFAFKYEFDRLDFWNQTLLQENTQFVFEKDCMTWTTSRAQGAYKSQLLSEQSEVCDRPQVIKIDEGHFAAIGEAALVNYARMKLAKNEEGWGVRSVLSGKVDLGLANYQSPWRYVMLANHPGQLVQNNYFILNLNEPNQIKDTRWIKPGQVIREVTLTTKGSLAAIDLAAENKIPYVEFDAGWYGSEYDPNSDATTITVDPKRSEGPLDLHQVIQYAKEKGIGIILYINMKALHKQLDEVLPLYQKWGIKGVKYGFVDVGDQYSTAWLHHAVRKAAKYKLMVDIHDEYRPTGYSRTYPNLLTQEGIRGDEESPSLKESIYTLYNRMICGAGDQTNCYFAQRVTDKMGGRAAQLAKLVAIYSPWQFIYWYDRPAAAPSRAGGAGAEESIIQRDEITDFYCSIPTVWDDTRFLEGEMGEYAVVARRSGSDWYISVLNAGKKRKIALPLDLLKNTKQYQATLYYQASTTSKNAVKVKQIHLSDQKALTIDVIANSGCVLHLSVPGDTQLEKEPLGQVIERGLDVSTHQALLMARKLEHQKGRLPKSTKNGQLETSDCYWWCSGFFPGELWYLYENSTTPELKKYAELFTSRLKEVQHVTNNHDVGFMLYCSYGNGYRLTQNPDYKEVLITGAQSLSTRFNPKVNAIRSWDFNKNKWQYPVIIDNMMNLELLTWAGKVAEKDHFTDVAVKHANTTLAHHFRKDGSCFHVVSYDTLTGKPHIKMTHQGYADHSSWARGQSWALYGYTMMARETGKAEYLAQAKLVASFLMNHPTMPTDKVPYWDFDAPDIPDAPRDASAAAIMASALIELSQLDHSEQGKEYLRFAEQQIRSLSSPAYLAEKGSNHDFVLKHSTGHWPGKSEIDVPLSYADYYYVEALVRLKKLNTPKSSQCNGTEDRNLWIKILCRIADPVLENLSSNTLKKNMPYESLSKDRRIYSHLEAVGRLVCGIAPWLELGKEETPEGKLRTHYIDLTVKGLKNAVDPQSPDYLEFGKPSQPLVDAAFLAQGLLRAPKQLWGNLDQQTRDRMITELKRTRNIKPSENNWLLFSSMVEAALLEFTNECDQSKLLYGIQKFQNEWYKGDAIYGDGSQFHMDYYNSFVIHPMLTDILQVMKKHTMKEADFLDTQIKRHTRYAEILERYISPEGTFPAVGRSIVYRFGAFHALSQAALHHILPNTVSPSQVRCALTAVIRNQMKSDANFDNNGWLSVGFTGKQIEMSESYINTGSAYLCSFGLLALGLPDSDPFWSAPDEEWTNLRAWNGGKVAADHALKDK